MSWIDKAIKDMEDYFENVSDEQLKKDLKEAGYERYKNIKRPPLFIPDRLEQNKN